MTVHWYSPGKRNVYLWHSGKLGTVSLAALEEETWRLRDDRSDSLWLPSLLLTLLSNSSRHSSSGDTRGFCLSLPPLLLSLQNSKRSTQVIPGLFWETLYQYLMSLFPSHPIKMNQWAWHSSALRQCWHFLVLCVSVSQPSVSNACVIAEKRGTATSKRTVRTGKWRGKGHWRDGRIYVIERDRRGAGIEVLNWIEAGE